jgi:hypothetical protein
MVVGVVRGKVAVCAWLLLLSMQVGCAGTRDVTYDTTAIRRVYAAPLRARLHVRRLLDARHGHAPSAVLFRGDRETEIGGTSVCVNAEEHYPQGQVAEQVTGLIAAHLQRRGLFAEVTTGAGQRGDYELRGSLRALYGRQETSTAAQVGSQFGLLGALATMGVTSKGHVQIALADLRLLDARGIVRARLDDITFDFEGELSADAYCWAIYDNVNEKLKLAVGQLAVAVEHAVREPGGITRPSAAAPALAVRPASHAPVVAQSTDAERRQREAEQRAAREAEQERQLAAHQAWQAESNALGDERSGFALAGITTAAAGVVFVGAGALMAVSAGQKNADAQGLAGQWEQAFSASARAPLAREITHLEHQRDLWQGLAVGAFVLGGAALASSAALWIMRPGLPDEPPVPGRARGRGVESALRVSPLLGAGTAGLTLAGAL